MSKTFLLQAIQFSINALFKFKNSKHSKPRFSSIWPIDRTLSGAATPGQSGPGSDGNEEVLRISQSFSITGTSPTDCLMSYPEHSLRSLTPLQRCSQCILQSQPTGQIAVLITGMKSSGNHIWCLCFKSRLIVWLFHARSNFIQIISSISNNSVYHEYTV